MLQSWDDIRDRYRSVQAKASWATDMIALVNHIADSPVAKGLFPWTSMFDLCITQVPRSYVDLVPFLRISPKDDGRIEFRYFDTGVPERQWSRLVEPEHAIDRFDKFVEQLHWVVTTAPLRESGSGNH
jgi:hypothetical protein